MQHQNHPWFQTSASFPSSGDLKTTLDEVLGLIVDQLDVDAAAILLRTDKSDSLEYVAWLGFEPAPATEPALADPEPAPEPEPVPFNRDAMRKRLRVIKGGGRKPAAMPTQDPLFEQGFVDTEASPIVLGGRNCGVLRVLSYQPLARNPHWGQMLENWASQIGVLVDKLGRYDRLEHSNDELNVAVEILLETLARAVDAREHLPEGHTQEVADLTVRLARVFGLDETALLHVRRGALLHDLGKLELPDRLLTKRDPLTHPEWATIRAHPLKGYEMLSYIDLLNPALDIPYYHHERWDGTGYPYGLRGEEIPLAARIFAVVDGWQVLRCARPFREAWSEERVAGFLREQAGRQFDPAIVRLFLAFRFPDHNQLPAASGDNARL